VPKHARQSIAACVSLSKTNNVKEPETKGIRLHFPPPKTALKRREARCICASLNRVKRLFPTPANLFHKNVEKDCMARTTLLAVGPARTQCVAGRDEECMGSG